MATVAVGLLIAFISYSLGVLTERERLTAKLTHNCKYGRVTITFIAEDDDLPEA